MQRKISRDGARDRRIDMSTGQSRPPGRNRCGAGPTGPDDGRGDR
jgi:hypothetical protein